MLKVREQLHDFLDASFSGVPDTRYIHIIQEWGQEVVLSGLEVIRDRIHGVGYSCAEVMKLGPDARLSFNVTPSGCAQAFNITWRLESAFSWMLEELGSEISDEILFKLLNYPDYDVSILAADLLNWNKHDRHSVDQHLLEAFHTRKGTAFRLSAATTLYMHGNSIPLEIVAVPNLISNLIQLEEKLTDEEKKKRQEDFQATDPDEEELSEFFLDSIGDPRNKFLSRVEKIITWDIATKGNGPRSKWPDWWIRE